jgi:hypothetical protein
MTNSLRAEVPWTVDETAERRIAEHSSRFNPPGLGTLAALDYEKNKKRLLRAKKAGERTELHIREVQAARQAMIDAGIIKPVVEVENVLPGTISPDGNNS